MISTQINLLRALSQLHPDGYEGIDPQFPTPNNYTEYAARLLPGFTAYTEEELDAGLAAWEAAAPERARAHLTLTPPQFRKMLRIREIKDSVEAAIAAITDPATKADYEDWYNFLPAEIRRTAPRVEAVRQILGISAVDADNWFSAAAEYE